MIESAIRGGLSYVAQCHAVDNFPAMPNYRPNLLTLHLLYLDCSFNYTRCQLYPLPVGDLRFQDDDELAILDVATSTSATSTIPQVCMRCTMPIHLRLNICTSTMCLMHDVTGVAHHHCTKLVSNLCY